MQDHYPVLTEDEARALRLVAGMMIPASTAFAMPGADDDAIFADILDSIERDAALVKQALQRLDALAGGVFADLDLAHQLLSGFIGEHPPSTDLRHDLLGLPPE